MDAVHDRAPTTRVGAYAFCLDDGGRLLLCRVSVPGPVHGAWTLPGGGIVFGEPPSAGALRELAEETGYVGEIEDVIDVVSHTIDGSASQTGRPVHLVGIIFRTRIVGGEPRDEIDGSTDRCAWFEPAEIAALRLLTPGRAGVRLAFGDAQREE
jgi:8-oxo-dGTP diphosphatase